ncbi:unnamed protein product [Plutella xylostella]|uniref:Regulatory protein zeste n=1 Tax=Plutella xylostella TaxID=51655 RepID=A0A8S4CXJ5_PLUXY|nr:uncharacterized protein LOC105382267 [Plutella xylostella]CAG9087294.1 unnamed protein product [Plutella xylostella]
MSAPNPAGGAVCRGRVSAEQLDVLLNFMEEHPDFAAGKQSFYSRFSSSKLWRLLAERINAAADESGGTKKSPDKWCRYWADIKYKARKKSAAAGALGELSHHEERLRDLLKAAPDPAPNCNKNASRNSHSDEDRRATQEDETWSDGEGISEAAGVATEELLAEAAMRTALAAEKQAESVSQAVELLRELVGILRPRPPPPAPPQPEPTTLILHQHPHVQHQTHHRM